MSILSGSIRGLSGNSKQYIFRNGKFSIEPTLNDFVIQEDGTLFEGTELTIPFRKKGKKVFVLLDVINSNGSYQTIDTYFSTFDIPLSLPVNNYIYFPNCKAGTNDVILGMKSNDVIKFKCLKNMIKIKEIWVENSSGGA